MDTLKGRIAKAVSLASKKAGDSGDITTLNSPLDDAALSRQLAIQECRDLITACFGIMPREHYSPETIGRIIAYAQAIVAKATKGGKRMNRQEYLKISGELDQIREQLKFINKRQEQDRANLRHFADVALTCIIRVSDGVLVREYDPAARAEMQNLKIIALALKTLMPKPR